MKSMVENDEIEEVFKILEKYYHTTDGRVIQQSIAEDLISLPHALRLFMFYGRGFERNLMKVVIVKYGEEFINRKMTNVIKKIIK